MRIKEHRLAKRFATTTKGQKNNSVYISCALLETVSTSIEAECTIAEAGMIVISSQKSASQPGREGLNSDSTSNNVPECILDASNSEMFSAFIKVARGTCVSRRPLTCQAIGNSCPVGSHAFPMELQKTRPQTREVN